MRPWSYQHKYMNFTIDDIPHCLLPFCNKIAFLLSIFGLLKESVKSNFLEKNVKCIRGNLQTWTIPLIKMFIWGTCDWYTRNLVLLYCSCPTLFYFLRRIHSRILNKGILPRINNNIELQLFSPITEVWYFDWLNSLTLKGLKRSSIFF